MISLKPGVRLLGLRSEMVLAHGIIASVFAHHGHDCVITSATDGRHLRGSEHYVGAALDYRLNNLEPITVRALIAADVRRALGSDFDVLHEYEGTAEEHLHVEFDPKESY